MDFIKENIIWLSVAVVIVTGLISIALEPKPKIYSLETTFQKNELED